MAASLYALRGGRGPTLLLVHGIGSSATAWTKQVERLGHHFSCIAPDLPGYGASPDPIGPGLDAFVDRVAALVAKQPVHIVGVSFGALVALAFARRHAPWVRSLVLADATLGRAAWPDPERQRWLADREALASELATRSLARAEQIAGPSASPDVIAEIAAHMERARASGYIAVARAIAATDARAWLPGITVPALVLCGDEDRVTGLAVSQVLAAELPNARLVRIPRAGHAPHIEQPECFAAAVRDFLLTPTGLEGASSHPLPR